MTGEGPRYLHPRGCLFSSRASHQTSIYLEDRGRHTLCGFLALLLSPPARQSPVNIATKLPSSPLTIGRYRGPTPPASAIFQFNFLTRPAFLLRPFSDFSSREPLPTSTASGLNQGSASLGQRITAGAEAMQQADLRCIPPEASLTFHLLRFRNLCRLCPHLTIRLPHRSGIDDNRALKDRGSNCQSLIFRRSSFTQDRIKFIRRLHFFQVAR